MNNYFLLLNAIHYAAEKHKNQRRKGKTAPPYINHPIKVATIISEYESTIDITVLTAAVLHDVLEDTMTTREEMALEFGDKTTSIVVELTDNKKLPKTKRKRLQVENAPFLSRQASIVRLADKIANLMDILEDPPKLWNKKMIIEYTNWAKDVVDSIRGTHSKMELLFDETHQKIMNKFKR